MWSDVTAAAHVSGCRVRVTVVTVLDQRDVGRLVRFGAKPPVSQRRLAKVSLKTWSRRSAAVNLRAPRRTCWTDGLDCRPTGVRDRRVTVRESCHLTVRLVSHVCPSTAVSLLVRTGAPTDVKLLIILTAASCWSRFVVAVCLCPATPVGSSWISVRASSCPPDALVTRIDH